MSLCHDPVRSALALELLDGGLLVNTATIATGNPNAVVVRISPRGALTIGVPDMTAKSKPKKLSQKARDAKVAAYIANRLRECPDAIVTVREAVEATRIPRSTLSRCAPYRAHLAKHKKRRPGKLRAIQLKSEMVACIPNRSADDPADIAEANELAELIVEQQRDDKSNRVR